jgi:hypothetical protein
MLYKDTANAYIVRIWIERRELVDAPVQWRGSIEHLASGRVKYLTDLNELVWFIRPYLAAMGITFDSATDIGEDGA